MWSSYPDQQQPAGFALGGNASCPLLVILSASYDAKLKLRSIFKVYSSPHRYNALHLCSRGVTLKLPSPTANRVELVEGLGCQRWRYRSILAHLSQSAGQSVSPSRKQLQPTGAGVAGMPLGSTLLLSWSHPPSMTSQGCVPPISFQACLGRKLRDALFYKPSLCLQ